MKRVFILKGLDCPNCSAKIEKEVGALQNIVIALGIKSVFLVLGALGMAGMWEAVFGDVGVTIIAVLNAMRILKK